MSRYQDVIDNVLFAGSEVINGELMNMLNVKYLIARQPLPEQFKPIHQQEDFTVFENQNVLPKAFFVDTVNAARSPSEALEAIQRTREFNPKTTAIAERAESLRLTPDTTASVNITAYGPREIDIQYQRQTDGYLVLSEIYYPKGWTASIDGNDIPIEATNYILRGMKVPAGEHTLTLRFDPASHVWGSRIAWAGNFVVWLLGLLVIGQWWQGRNQSSEE
jgi:uncharacterized membrane protein YfhO